MISLCTTVSNYSFAQARDHLLIYYLFYHRRPCKVGVKYLEDGTKVRVARGTGTSGSIIPRPEILKIRATPRPTTGT